MKTCKECGWKVIRAFSLSWEELGVCPRCANTKTLDNEKYSEPVIGIEINPVDMYWNYVTSKALLTNEVKC
jgi:hypothetical protein